MTNGNGALDGFVLVELLGWAVTVWASFKLPAAIAAGKVRASPNGVRTMRDVASRWNRNPPGIAVLLLILWPPVACLMVMIVFALVLERWEDRTVLRRRQND